MAGRIPQDFINDLVDRADIVEIISSRIQLKKAGREYKACCPFHGEKTPSFTVSPDKGFYHCFGCGAHGTVVGFLMEHDRLEFVEAVEELASYYGQDVPRERSSYNTESPSGNAALYELLNKAAERYQAELRNDQAAIEYLKQRGLDGKTAADFRIGVGPAGWDFILKALGKTDTDRDNLLKAGLVTKNEENRVYDRFRGRIMFPIRDGRGRIIGFGGRVMDNSEPKYLNSPETPVFHKGRELYGLYEARQAVRNPERLLVVEGYMDVVALAHHGIRNAVATLGTATTPDHLRTLFRFTLEIVFCFDGDKAGRKAAWRALEMTLPELKEGRQVRFLFLEEGADPDSVVRDGGAAAFNERLAQSLPLSEYLIEHLKAETDLNSLDGQARLAELARPLLGAIPEGVYRELLLDRLAAEVGMPAERLGQHLGSGADAPPAPRRRSAQSAAPQPAEGGPKTLIRKAVCLALQHPEAIGGAQVPDGLFDLPNPGIALLNDLLQTAAENPDIRPARLAEDFADHPDGGTHLQTLLVQDLHLDPGANWQQEFEQTLVAILRQELERRIRSLSARPASSLSAAEKTELRELYGQLSGHHGAGS
ncbi:MAG: DNA primase [Gammaproteobacteria bacterium]|nr:DNA primase [Gammaproteobacteria bacterium]